MRGEEFYIEKIEDRNITGWELRLKQWNHVKISDRNKESSNFSPENFQKLCRGDPVYFKDEDSYLGFCFYMTRNDPYLLLQPVKTELVSKQPLLVKFHDILHIEQIKEIKKLSHADIFERASFGEEEKGSPMVIIIINLFKSPPIF